MKSNTMAYLPWILANILLFVGLWLTGIEIGSWRIGGVQWAWGSTVGILLLIAVVVFMSALIIRAERRKRN